MPVVPTRKNKSAVAGFATALQFVCICVSYAAATARRLASAFESM